MSNESFNYSLPDEESFYSTLIDWLEHKGKEQISDLLKDGKCVFNTTNSYSHMRWNAYGVKLYLYLPMNNLKEITDDVKSAIIEASNEVLQKQDGYDIVDIEASPLIVSSRKKDENPERVYGTGQAYDFYRDIKELILTAKSEVFVIDAYATEDIIDLYLDKLSIGLRIMILTKESKGNFESIAKKFKLKHGSNFIVKINDKCHDRLFFVDKRCYVIGQSIDKAALNKPTYVLEIQNGGLFRNVFQPLFDSGKTLV